MIETVITALCTFIILTGEASAQNAISKGQHPFAAFIYYTDETITDVSGERFLQSAVLVKLEWLISASIDPHISGDVVMGFPEKTLVARVGAITIDSKFTFNEDDEEQEREVVQVVRPNGHIPDKAVSTDITLLKTLLPFTSSMAVGIANVNMLTSLSDKSCSILVFVKTKANSEEKSLIEIPVLMQKSKEQCGPDFKEDLMACGDDSEQSKATIDENHYCHGNAGGPLICESEVAGIQSYINQVCHQPHLFNLFSGWSTFINCGIEKGCLGNCHKICRSVHKDENKSLTETSEITSYIHSEAVESTDPANVSAETMRSTIPTRTELSTEGTTTSIPVPTNATETTTTTTESTSTKSTTTTTTEIVSKMTTSSTTPSTVITTPESNTAPSTPPSAHKEEVESVVVVITRPDANVRNPKIESFSAMKKDPKIDDMSGRRKNAMNSSSARYLNGLLIIFLNLVVAI